MSSLPLIDTPSGSLDYEGNRDALLQSLELQRRALARSIVLTPADSLPLFLADRDRTGFLHGLYLTDKDPDSKDRKNAPILFGGREHAARDLRKIQNLLAEALQAAAGSLRLLSGLHAHTATFMSISRIGQKVMLLPVSAGGHFNTHAILQRLGLHTIDLPVDNRRLCVDRSAALELIHREQPDFLFIDRSEGLRYEDFGFIGELNGPRTIFDASHYLPQILTGRYANPLSWGFNLMLFSLHKSFPGPQKAGVVSREDDDLWADLLAGLSRFVSSSHAEDTYLLGLTLLQPDLIETYTHRLLETAEELELQLLRHGIGVIPRTKQGFSEWPGTHHLWLRAESKDAAYAQFERLSKANLHTNYRELPYGLGYGLRLGTSFSAVAGVSLDHIEDLSTVIKDALTGADSNTLRSRVRLLAESAESNSLIAPS